MYPSTVLHFELWNSNIQYLEGQPGWRTTISLEKKLNLLLRIILCWRQVVLEINSDRNAP